MATSFHTARVEDFAAERPTSNSTSTKRPGRPNGWTESRQRKLARLYIYSDIPTKDIPKVLKDEEAKWVPGQVSITKTVNSLLDKEPRWLRPKTQDDKEQRMARLADSRAQRKLRRDQRAPAVPSDLRMQSLTRNLNLPKSRALNPSEFFEAPFLDYSVASSNCDFGSILQDVRSSADLHLSFEDGNSGPADGATGNALLDCTSTNRAASVYSGLEPTKPDRPRSACFSISSLKNRLSKYSNGQLRDIVRLVKEYSMTGSSAASIVQPVRAPSIRSDYASTIRELSSAATVTRKARLILPSSILILDEHLLKQGFCAPGMKAHDANSCWCLDELRGSDNLWVHREGYLNKELTQWPTHLSKSTLDFRDAFGNTILHMLAARGAEWHLILKALAKGVDGNFKNSAQQTFLHVLPQRTMFTLAEDCTALMALLQSLSQFSIKFHECDIFGRSFFHLLTHALTKVCNQSFWVSFWGLEFFKPQLNPSRDAFGWTAEYDKRHSKDLDSLISTRYDLEPLVLSRRRKRSGQIKADLSTAVNTERAQRFILKTYQSCDPAKVGVVYSALPEVSFIKQHHSIIRTVDVAISNPGIEDPRGRNGLHCLAEALLPLDRKRKRNSDSIEQPSDALTLLFNLTQALLGAGIKANHYDKAGNSVLISFVKHRQDGEDDKILAAIFQLLLGHSCNIANIHWRNREGESALHVAVRLGRKVATRVLLANGANVHARNSEGEGVLAVGEKHYFRARGEPALYASIHSCMALAADHGAVAAPTLSQEWSMGIDDLYKI